MATLGKALGNLQKNLWVLVTAASIQSKIVYLGFGSAPAKIRVRQFVRSWARSE